MPQLLSINVAQPQAIEFEGKSGPSAIAKSPVQGAVMLRMLNLDGDRQADLKNHGGHDKAVYGYTVENLHYWADTLGRALTYGQFGENLTVSDMPEDQLFIGNIYRMGDAIIQITQPRIPCWKLEYRMGIAGFAKIFRESGRIGFYARVLQEGMIEVGNPLTLFEQATHQISVRQLIAERYSQTPDKDFARRALAIEHLPTYWKQKFQAIVRDKQ